MSSSRATAWFIWVVVSVFYAYQYLLRVMPNIMMSDIMTKFDIGATAFGQFSGIYYIGYSLMHLPIGIMLDRCGPKKVIAGCLLLTILGLAPLIFSSHWIFPIVGRLLIGIGSSAAILGVFKIVRMAFSEAQFPRMLSFSVMIGLIGAIYGGGPVSYMKEVLGYDFVIESFMILGALLAIVSFFIMPDSVSTSESSVLSDLKEVLGNKKLIWCCVFAGLMVGPLEGFADVWGTVFLKTVYKMDSTVAASLPSMIFIGMCFGSPLLSFIADRFKSYLGTINIAGIIMGVIFFSLLKGQLDAKMITISFVVIGICSAYQILAIYKASTYVRKEVSGIATAVANMIIMIFGYGFHTSIGWVINRGGGALNETALIDGISIVPFALGVGAIGFAILMRLDAKQASSNVLEDQTESVLES